VENLNALIVSIKNCSNKGIEKRISNFFNVFFNGCFIKSTPEFNSEKDRLASEIAMLIKSEISGNYILDEISKRMSFSRERNDYDEIIIYALVSAETTGANSILLDILRSDSFALKAYIFYHRVCSVSQIFQTPECRLAIVNFINSNQFSSIYSERCKRPGYHSELFAFPGHYISCFEIREFDEIKAQNYSSSKLSKMATEARLESIRLIKDPFFKMELIKRYFNSLPVLYKTRFVKLVDKTFPELELKKNGHSVYSYCL